MDGDFVIVWSGQDGSGAGVFGRRFDSSGASMATEFQVNTYVLDNQRVPSVGMNGSGGFVVVWMSYGQDGEGLGIFARRFDSEGLSLGGEFQVHTHTSGHQYQPAIGMGHDGDFVISWRSFDQLTEVGIFAQRFDASARRQGPAFPVNASTEPFQGSAAVEMDGDGDFVVTWQGGVPTEILGRRFDGTGSLKPPSSKSTLILGAVTTTPRSPSAMRATS